MDDAILKLTAGLPDAEAARRFFQQLEEKNTREFAKLVRDAALSSDVAALVSFSPLLATTMLQNPDYFWWLDRKRRESGVRSTEELLESLARFALTNSQLEPQVIFARFRRRELLRIYLRDIRRLATIAEITEEISNLADAILEYALKLGRREIDNRYGPPQEVNEKGRATVAKFCIVALGKLGSRELNYSSDIDLIFLYSSEGNTFGVPASFGVPALAGPPAKKPPEGGTPNGVTNREYFVKLAEYIVRLTGAQTGEGAPYRVDLRLRPRGTLGALAMSVGDTIKYFETEARGWERQVLIRSRGCAGDIELFKQFFAAVEPLVFSANETVETALANVRSSKQKIDLENINRKGLNVKLGRGGIREIEFIAQALQLAHGGLDRWLRRSHTLISLTRLAERKHLSDAELTQLSDAYEFLRRTEHILQMENGTQTHTIPTEKDKRELLARRMTFISRGDFEAELKSRTRDVSEIFGRVFGSEPPADGCRPTTTLTRLFVPEPGGQFPEAVSIAANWLPANAGGSDCFAALRAANPDVVFADKFTEHDFANELLSAVASEKGLGHRLAILRRTWQRFLLEIGNADLAEIISITDAKRQQTQLAEASIAAALRIAVDEAGAESFISVLALGKLGAGSLDYGSDLDLVMVYDAERPVPEAITHAEFYSRIVELFMTALSSITRDGNLYRVDLRLRPYGSKGLSAIGADKFLEYFRDTAAIWEMLAFVKLRAVGGDMTLGENVERETRRIIHERAAATDPKELAEETRRIRAALEKRAKSRRANEIDIKYGAGGMLDVYFAARYLQLLRNVPDDSATLEGRSTIATLERLAETDDAASLAALKSGYEFLSNLDHNVRLFVGRTNRVPFANQTAMAEIASRMNLESAAEIEQQLTLNRLAIREAFDGIFH